MQTVTVHKKRRIRWLALLVLGLGALIWWYQGNTFPKWAPDWGRRSAPSGEAAKAEYRLAGGFPAAASLDVFRRLSALSQGDDDQTTQRLRDQGLVWETTEGLRVQVVSQRASSREVEVREVVTGKAYWTYVDALEK
ncbi:MAG TPA: hypothetical protein VEI04_02630 [Syntrophobacteria bacterium]|nr:hypothetical protein [Syntrophobacteria bacterium]